MNAWAYLVVSTDKQSDTREDQADWARAVATANSWMITRTFGADALGISSGKAGVRGLLQHLIDELDATPKGQRPARILMRRLDRVGRMALHSIAALAQIRKLGVTIHTEIDGDVQLETAMDALRPMFELITAEIENSVRSQKWKAVHARRRAAGLHVGMLPFGFVLMDGRAVPYEPEAAVVRELFDLAGKSWGYTRLARWARERAPTKRMSDGSERPMAWAPSTVKSILFGATTRAKLVDEATIARMEATRGQDFRVRSPKRWKWPLTGAIRCTCGKRMSGHCSGLKNYRIRYYACRSHTLEPGQTAHPAHRADALEKHFVGILKAITAQPDIYLPRRPKSGLEALRSREQSLKTRIAKLNLRRRRACELAEDGSYSGPQLRERLDEIEADRSAWQNEVSRVGAEIAAASQYDDTEQSLVKILDHLVDVWLQADVQLQQEIARTIGELPGVNGLWASPDRRGELMTGAHVALLAESDDSITKKFIQSITE